MVDVRVNFTGVQRLQNDDPKDRANLMVLSSVQHQAPPPSLRVNFNTVQRVEYQLVLPQTRVAFFITQYVQRAPDTDMVDEVYPTLRGLTFGTSSKPMFSTDVAEHTSGKETATQYWDEPKWEFKLQYDYLPNKTPAANTDFKTLVGFFLARKGRFEPFLFKAPDDHFVESLQLGIGNGIVTEFQMYRPMGSYQEPIGQADPDNTTIFVEVQAEPHTVPASGPYTVTLDHTDIDEWFSLQQGVTVYTRVDAAPAVNQYVLDEGTGVITFNSANAGANVTARYRYVAVPDTDFTLLMPRTLAFLTAPPNNAVITGTYQFFFVVRFLDDVAEFDQFYEKLWELGQIEFRSVLL